MKKSKKLSQEINLLIHQIQKLISDINGMQ